VELLREAVAVLATSVARLEHARALADLGGAMRRAGHRSDARTPLREALTLAHQCGAHALAEQARTDLLATGARPRSLVLTGVESLTPSERRIADLAAAGNTNRAIAQALFVTMKTVEMHLANSYRKLGIHSRGELIATLAEPPAATT
jgi:DNA-binding CsgD family transcriptional regulator